MKEGFTRFRAIVLRQLSRVASSLALRPRWLVAGLVLSLLVAGSLLTRQHLLERPTVVAYSEIVSAINTGTVAQLWVEAGGTRIEAQLAGDEGGRLSAVLPSGSLDLADLERWAAAGAQVHVERGAWSGVATAAPFFLTLILLGAVFFLVFRVHRGGARTRRFGPTPEDRRLTLDDVGGAREACDELRDVIAYLRDPARFDAMGAACPKGVLLMGPPGTGKTLLARAVAGESGVPVISASGSEFTEMYVGVGARRVRDLAKQARQQAPCIVFIDEFDSIGGKRGRANRSGEDETTLNQLLVEMDGLDGNAGVVWMAATNREDMLDPALRRPGRFDRIVEVGMPTSSDRLEILKVHAARRPLASDVDLEKLASLTIGYSGADIANLLNEAAILAVHDDCTEITNAHIDQARDKILLGRIRAGVVISAQEQRLVALHEAGHVIVGLVACPDDRLHKVTIEPRGRSLGAAHFAPDADRHLYSRRYLEGVIAKALGGRAAELVFLGSDAVTSGAGSDLVHATGVARRMVGEFGMSGEVGLVSADPAAQGGNPSPHLQAQIDGAVRTLIEVQASRAEAIVREHQAAVEALASALQEHLVLSADDVHTIAATHGIHVATPLIVA